MLVILALADFFRDKLAVTSVAPFRRSLAVLIIFVDAAIGAVRPDPRGRLDPPSLLVMTIAHGGERRIRRKQRRKFRQLAARETRARP